MACELNRATIGLNLEPLFFHQIDLRPDETRKIEMTNKNKATEKKVATQWKWDSCFFE